MSNHYKALLPWLGLMVGGTVFLQFFLRAKFKYKPIRQGELQINGLSSDDSSLERIYKEMVEDNKDLDKWNNVRGPRPEEDNVQFEEAKAQRKKESEANREKFRARREEFKRQLEQLQR